MESLESRKLLSGTVTATLGAGLLTLNGDGAANRVNLGYTSGAFTLNDPVSSTVFNVGSIAGATGDTTSSATIPYTGAITQVHINLSGGANTTVIDLSGDQIPVGIVDFGTSGLDRLTVSLPNGKSLPTVGSGASIDHQGSIGDILEIVGAGASSTQTITYRPSGVATGAGQVDVGANYIAFSGLSPVYLNGLANVNVATAVGDQRVKITDSAVPGVPSLEIAPDGGPGVAFETAYVWNDATVTVNTTANAGAGAVRIVSADGTALAANITNLTIQTAGAADAITVVGAVIIPNALQLSASLSNVTETTGTINAASLTTTSATGTVLGNANVVSTFNTTNSTSGNVQLTNTAAPLTISGISETGGNISVTNAGTTTVTGTVQASAAGTVLLVANGVGNNINLNANVTSGSGQITLTAANDVTLNAGGVSTAAPVNITATAGAISEAGAGAIIGTTLTTNSATGTVLANTNAVSTFNATNSTSGNVQLVNNQPLGITGINETGGNIIVTNAGTVTISGTVQAAGSGTVNIQGFGGASSILVNANVTSGSGQVLLNAAGSVTLNAGSISTTGPVNLTGTSGTISQPGAGTISGGTLTTSSGAGATLTNANAVTGLNAANFVSGNFQLTNTLPLNILLLSNLGGNVIVVNTGTITVSGTVSAAAAGTVALTANGAGNNISLNANVTSGSGQITLLAANNVTLNAGGISTAAPVNLTATAGAISETGSGAISGTTLTTASVTGTTLNSGNTVAAFTALNTTSGNIQLTNTAAPLTLNQIIQNGGNTTINNTGAIQVAGTIKDLAGTVTLIGTNTITETTGKVLATALSSQSANGATLANDNNVSSFNATNSTAGDVWLNNSIGPLAITGATNANSGKITVTNFGGGAPATGINVTGTVSTTGQVILKEYTADIQDSGPGLISAGSLTTISKLGTTLNGSNAVSSLIAQDDSPGAGFWLTNTVPLTVNGIFNQTGNVTIQNSGGITVPGPIVNLAVGGTISLTDSTAGISAAGELRASTLTTSTATGASMLGPNRVDFFGATNSAGGTVALNNTAAPLTITGVNQTGGDVQIINFGGGGAATGTTVAGLVTATGQTVTLKEYNGGIQEFGAGGRVVAGTLVTISKNGTLLLNANNQVGGLNALNDPAGAFQLNNNTASLIIASIVETGAGTVTINNTGGVIMVGGQAIQASGQVTLNVGTGGGGSVSTLGGTIASPLQVNVSGGTGNDALTVNLGTAVLPAAGLIFNGGAAAETNALTVHGKPAAPGSPAGTVDTYLCTRENSNNAGNPGVVRSTTSSPVGVAVSFANIKNLTIQGDTGNDTAEFNVGTGVNPLASYVFSGGAGWNAMVVKGTAGNDVIGVGDTNYLGLDEVKWDPVNKVLSPAYPLSPILPPITYVPLRLKVDSNDVAILQMFGYAGDDVLIGATAVSETMIDGAAGEDTISGGAGGLLGGAAPAPSGVDILLGGRDADVIYGRGALNYLLGDYEWNAGQVVISSPTPPASGHNRLVGGVASNVFIGAPGDTLDGTSGIIVGTGQRLTPTLWLGAGNTQFVDNPAPFLAAINARLAVLFVSNCPY